MIDTQHREAVENFYAGFQEKNQALFSNRRSIGQRYELSSDALRVNQHHIHHRHTRLPGQTRATPTDDTPATDPTTPRYLHEQLREELTEKQRAAAHAATRGKAISDDEEGPNKV